MKKYTALLLALALLLAGTTALADWSPSEGASPEFIEGLTQQNPAVGHTQTPGAWEYGHIQVGYTEVAYAGPAADVGAAEPVLTPYELAALYWAEHKDGFTGDAYNLNEIDGGVTVRLCIRPNSTCSFGIWAGNRIFSITTASIPETTDMSRSDFVTTYNTTTDEVTGSSSGTNTVDEWLKWLLADFKSIYGDDATATLTHLNP